MHSAAVSTILATQPVLLGRCAPPERLLLSMSPGTATSAPTSVSTPPPTSVSSTTSHSSTSASSTTSAPSSPAATGFVGVQAEVRAWWEHVHRRWTELLLGRSHGYSQADIDKAFADIASSGATVVRTWGFNEVTSPNGIYYQSWSGSTPTINTGATGLQNFDYVVASAKAHGLKLIVALTNNWSDYGGMDVYVKQILGSQNHDLFYTDATVIAAFKNYVKTFVGRYLANEPRCKGSTGTSADMHNYHSYQLDLQISAYIKSIDSNHLVQSPSNPSYPYQLQRNLAVKTIDFGTFHLYPESWGQSSNPSSSAWGSQWIADHATSQKAANKPVIIEEFGVTTDQPNVYTTWYNEV
ncbi:glycoside hydrolase superfamily, partial [Irpex lacteus]